MAYATTLTSKRSWRSLLGWGVLLAVVAHRGFTALRPAPPGEDEAHKALRALAAAAVRFFSPLRTPPEAAEIARRMTGAISPRQVAYALEWGYPYIFEEYDFHITLTGPLQSAVAAPVRAVLAQYFEEVTAQALPINQLCVCRQAMEKTHATAEKHTEAFTVVECFPLSGVTLTLGR